MTAHCTKLAGFVWFSCLHLAVRAAKNARLSKMCEEIARKTLEFPAKGVYTCAQCEK